MSKDLTGKWCVVMPKSSDCWIGKIESDHHNGVVEVRDSENQSYPTQLWTVQYLSIFKAPLDLLLAFWRLRKVSANKFELEILGKFKELDNTLKMYRSHICHV